MRLGCSGGRVGVREAAGTSAHPKDAVADLLLLLLLLLLLWPDTHARDSRGTIPQGMRGLKTREVCERLWWLRLA